MSQHHPTVFEPLEDRLLLSADVVYALNVGGPTVEVNGQQWLSDSAPIAGITTNFAQANATTTSTSINPIDTSRPSVSLTGHSDPILKQADLTLTPLEYMQVPSEIFSSLRLDQAGGSDLTYLFDVQPGKYRVDLYFSEPTSPQAGLRVMDIFIEGSLAGDDLDIAEETGAVDVAIGRSFLVDSDSSLSLTISNQTGDGVLQGIRVVSAAGYNADIAFNPTTLNPVGLSLVNSNDVILLMPGEYNLSDLDIQAMFDNSANQRDGVTYLGVPGQTVLDFTDQSEVKLLVASTFSDRIAGLVFDGLTFLNAGLTVQYSTGARITNTVFDGYSGKAMPEGAGRVANFWRNPSAEFTNNYFRWDSTSKNIDAIGVGGSNDGLVADNHVEGRLRKAIQLWKYDGMVARGNMVERWSGTPGPGGELEDHGIYVHDSSNVLVESNYMRGWSDTASGQGLKLKNVDHVEVTDNDFFTSGLIGRVETAVVGPRFEQVWIHNNRFHQGSINIWTPTIAPVSIRIEDNVLQHGNITAKRDVNATLFNQALDFGPMTPGGVYANSATAYDLAPGVSLVDNTIYGTVAGDITGDSFVGISDLNILLSNWNQSVDVGDQLFGDLAGTGDGFVGISDLNVILSNWNAGTPPMSNSESTDTDLTGYLAARTADAIEVLAQSVEVTSPDRETDIEPINNKLYRHRIPVLDTSEVTTTSYNPDQPLSHAAIAWRLHSIQEDASRAFDAYYIPQTMRQDKATALLYLWDDINGSSD